MAKFTYVHMLIALVCVITLTACSQTRANLFAKTSPSVRIESGSTRSGVATTTSSSISRTTLASSSLPNNKPVNTPTSTLTTVSETGHEPEIELTPAQDNGVYNQKGGKIEQSAKNYTADANDQSVILVSNGGQFILADSEIVSSGSASNLDSAGFYGLNAAVLAKSGGNISLSNCTVITSGRGANGVFANGTGSIINLDSVTISCLESRSHGIVATDSGQIICSGVSIDTAGNGAAAGIATDQGGGTILFDAGSVNTSGSKSPGIYSSGSIIVSNSALSATASEAAVIEGSNSITLSDTDLYGSQEHGVLIYNSTSGDESTGNAQFDMSRGTLTCDVGPLFYCTNIEAVVNLESVGLTSNSGVILKAAAGSWGTEGSNGAAVVFSVRQQILEGDFILDKISSLELDLADASILTGAVNSDHIAQSVTINLDASSTWYVTANSYIDAFTDEDDSLLNIQDNGYTIFYDASNPANSWLNGQTYDLASGGTLTPMQ
jgi:hypothetical protein